MSFIPPRIPILQAFSHLILSHTLQSIDSLNDSTCVVKNSEFSKNEPTARLLCLQSKFHDYKEYLSVQSAVITDKHHVSSQMEVWAEVLHAKKENPYSK